MKCSVILFKNVVKPADTVQEEEEHQNNCADEIPEAASRGVGPGAPPVSLAVTLPRLAPTYRVVYRHVGRPKRC